MFERLGKILCAGLRGCGLGQGEGADITVPGFDYKKKKGEVDLHSFSATDKEG